MIILYFILALAVATAHSDYDVSFRAQNFEKTVQNINILNHQRAKRLVTGYFVPQNQSTHHQTWGNMNLTRNNTFNGPVANITRFKQNNTRPLNNNVSVIYPGQPGYVVPSNTASGITSTLNPYGGMTNVSTQNYVNPGQNYKNNVTRPGYSNYSNIYVMPVNKNNNTLNPVTPGYMPYPGYNTGYPGYPAPNSVYPAPNTGYQGPNTGYPATGGYPAPNTAYPAPNTGFPASKTGYPAPNVYPASNTGFAAPNTSYPRPIPSHPIPNTGYQKPNTFYPAPNVYPAPNKGYSVPNNGYTAPNSSYTAPNNTASFANCKCPFPRADSTITKEEMTMGACAINCETCPSGMSRSSAGNCVKVEELSDDYVSDTL